MEEDLDAFFSANDESDFQALDQINQQDIDKAPIGRHDQPRALRNYKRCRQHDVSG